MMDFKHNLKVLLTKEQIQTKIKEFADSLNKQYKDQEISLVGIMNGAIFFFADLLKHLNMPIKMDTITASSYSGTSSVREITFYKKITKPIIENKNVLIIEDIIDTGLTLTKIYEYLLSLKPKSLRIITLADKLGCHNDFKYEYESLFKVPNKFIVGYGFEIDDLYRQLDQIYYVDQD